MAQSFSKNVLLVYADVPLPPFLKCVTDNNFYA